MATRIPLYYDSTSKRHTPSDPAVDVVDPRMIPTSARAGNQLQKLNDGLYFGNQLAATTYYVSNAGTDTPTSGTAGQPFQTLDYCIGQLAAQSPSGLLGRSVTILLQAGQTFALPGRYGIERGAVVTIAWANDPTYGTYPGTPINGANPEVFVPLSRPIITPSIGVVNAQYRMAGFLIRGGGTLRLRGVQVNLPARPSPAPTLDAYSTLSDFVTAPNLEMGNLDIIGTNINQQDENAVAGFIGLEARAQGLRFTQYASRFLVGGTEVVSGDTATRLAARQWFIKFYPDYAGNNQVLGTLNPTAQNSSPGSGLIFLNWSDVSSLQIQTGLNNQRSYPVLFDTNAGLRNYVYGLQRDQQQRPLNIVVGRTFY